MFLLFDVQELLIKRKDGRRHRSFNYEKGPSDLWFQLFFKRHPDLKEIRPSGRDTGRARMSNEVVLDRHFTFLGNPL